MANWAYEKALEALEKNPPPVGELAEGAVAVAMGILVAAFVISRKMVKHDDLDLITNAVAAGVLQAVKDKKSPLILPGN